MKLFIHTYHGLSPFGSDPGGGRLMIAVCWCIPSDLGREG